MSAKGPVALLVVLLALAAGGCGDDAQKAASDARPATLALDFQPNAVHAGIFTAVDEGLDEREGVELTVRTPAASTDSLKLLGGSPTFTLVNNGLLVLEDVIDGTQTRVAIEKIQLDVDLPDRYFRQQDLGSGE